MSTCSPASSSSYDSNKGSASSCGDRPSTSDGFNKASNSSPAMARSVPSSHEATSPPETAASRDYVYFTTDMANQAVLDMEREKGTYGTLFEWHQRRRRPELEAQARPNSAARTPNSAPPLDLPQPASNATVPAVLTPTLPFSPHDEKVLTPLSEGPMSNEGRKGVKRKNEDDVQKEAKIAKTESGTAENSPLPPKPEENPLKKMELMTNSQQFHTILNDVVDAPAKKDERAAKLEKLDDIGKQVQVEQEMMKQREIMHQNYQMQMKRMQQQQPYMSPQYPMPGFPPGNPAMMPGGMPAGVQPPTSAAAGPFSAGAFPPGYPGLPNMPPMPGPYPPHFFPHGIPPGYPMSAPGKMPPFPSPGFPQPMAGMPPGGPRMPVPPHMMQHFYAQMAHMKPGAMSPGNPMMPQMPAGAKPSMTPPPGAFPMNPAYQQMMMGMAKNGMAPPYGFPHPGMMMPPHMHPGMPPAQQPSPHQMNVPGMLMVRPNGANAPDNAAAMNAWAPQLTPCYPPVFPQPPATTPNLSAPSAPSSAVPTPNK